MSTNLDSQVSPSPSRSSTTAAGAAERLPSADPSELPFASKDGEKDNLDLTRSERDQLGVELDPTDRELLKEVHQRSKSLDRKPSMSFVEPPGRRAPRPTDEKQLEDGFAGGLKPTRTFSRRDREASYAGEDVHMFGGDLHRQETELALSRFESQAGRDQIVVHWEGEDDSENPKNWSRAYRWYLTALSGVLVLNSTFTSSAPSGILAMLEKDLHMSQEVATLTIAIFVAGYCLGPLVWGPLSERKGRYPCFIIALTAYTAFNIGCALSKNTASMLVFRFLAGSFASSPLTTSGGIIADVWDAKTRGLALSLFSLAPFAGPALGPIVSGAISVTDTNWRWLFWVCTIFSGVCCIVTAVTLRETYAPIILVRKARRIRKETGSEKYVAPLELAPLKAKDLLHATLLKPFAMLFMEPMLLALTVYLSFVYGIVYLLFEAFPFVFQGVYGFNSLVSGLMFLPFFLGGVVGTILYAVIENPRYVRMADQARNGRVAPEQRLLIVMIAGPALAISFFWFGWTSYRSISFWCPMMAGALLGFSILFIFLGLFNYIVDAYIANAASALAANTVCRSAFGVGFPMFAAQMYTRLNQHWASTLLGCIGVLLAPVPFVLYAYGPKLRAMSKHAADF
ncbi:putative mfs-multidrug-resistance transporter [Tilletiaria anomala UBC 951]|uniref:Putative mfs-multidrug-resistance transporter n=1 Tax=Tilletiaria anomala (strain ATCC 24038 / CBS 436.72 / UBC 951) TaxID=1037660 RepID=A0A066WR99_TILAU|nr:putative mfs-multidrug-resistance transporter [Tilletiaria anomala UBC 951]KDN53529.1 putative mfs-multidrug-resistance transporter [Tilletiaria anomala UBC 951]